MKDSQPIKNSDLSLIMILRNPALFESVLSNAESEWEDLDLSQAQLDYTIKSYDGLVENSQEMINESKSKNDVVSMLISKGVDAEVAEKYSSSWEYFMGVCKILCLSIN